MFLKPLVAKLGGREFTPDIRKAFLGEPMKANDHRRDYVRALAEQLGGRLIVTPFGTQDSSMLKTLAAANALLIREPHAPAAQAGEPCRVLMLR